MSHPLGAADYDAAMTTPISDHTASGHHAHERRLERETFVAAGDHPLGTRLAVLVARRVPRSSLGVDVGRHRRRRRLANRRRVGWLRAALRLHVRHVERPSERRSPLAASGCSVEDGSSVASDETVREVAVQALVGGALREVASQER